eukprot:8925539-Pyramimonas_sp.AAC.1
MSCERGQGPAAQASALPFEELHRLPRGRVPWVPGGPANSRLLIIAGSWWLLREVELSTTRAALATPS